jgi:hypothetical protein
MQSSSKSSKESESMQLDQAVKSAKHPDLRHFFGDTKAWTQDPHLEPLHQPFFVMGFFQDRV